MTEIYLGGGLIKNPVGGHDSVYRAEVVGKTGVKAKIVAYSVSKSGQRIVTFELEYPRTIHSEVRTHCMLDMNASSSRAIPMKFMRDHVLENTAFPVVLTKNQSGMQGRELHDGWIDLNVIADVYKHKVKTVVNFLKGSGAEFDEEGLRISFNNYIKYWVLSAVTADHEVLERSGLHKQVVNRLLEPYQYIKTIVTGTEFDNFFNLRFQEDADPTIIELANLMAYLYYNTEPEELSWKEWHTPYVLHERDVSGKLHYFVRNEAGEKEYLSGGRDGDAVKVSCCACAQVSYRKLDTSPEKVQRVYDLLINGGIIHGSAFSHVACPMCSMSASIVDGESVNMPVLPKTWQDGITHMDRQGNLWSSKFKGWIQYRKLIPNENCVSFDYEKRKQEVYSTVVGSQLTQLGGG